MDTVCVVEGSGDMRSDELEPPPREKIDKFSQRKEFNFKKSEFRYNSRPISMDKIMQLQAKFLIDITFH